jgi:hypothetical protein
MVIPDEAQRLADYCRRSLPLAGAALGAEFGYPSLALCVIDAVWSIGVRYEAVTNVIRRYCEYLGGTPKTTSTPLSALTADMERRGIAFYADQVFQNRQRTSPRGGILKAEAVYRYAAVCARTASRRCRTCKRSRPVRRWRNSCAGYPLTAAASR